MNFITINKISGLFRQTILNFGHIALLLIANFPLILNSNSPSLYTIAEIANNKKNVLIHSKPGKQIKILSKEIKLYRIMYIIAT